jgi:uncharacterized membrane protein YagU involved in acid resistance
VRSEHPYTAIFGGALVAGTILAAWMIFSFTVILRMFSPLEALQWNASNVLGNAAYSQGFSSAAVGVVMHYLVALVWAMIYVFLFAKQRVVDMHPLVNGALFGVVVWFVMTFMVLSLGVGTHIDVNALSIVTGILANVVFFGMPLAYVVRRLE